MMLNLALIFLSLALVARLLLNAYKPGLRTIPGPFLAKFTSLWRLYCTRNGVMNEKILELHQKHGTLVRLSPHWVSISDARMVENIYGMKANFTKSPSYEPNMGYLNGRTVPSIFATQDKAEHARLKRPVASIYSMSSISSYEPLVNDILTKFLHALDERFISTGKPCRIDLWLQYLAFDVVSMITMSRPLGFIEQGKDVEGVLAQLEHEFDYRVKVSTVPFWDKIIRKNRIVSWLFGNNPFPLMVRSRKILDDRMTMHEDKDIEDLPEEMGRDFVSRILERREKNPTEITDTMLVAYVAVNLLAGSDTTAVVLRTALYCLMKSPRILATLRAELDVTQLTFPVPYSAAYKLPYLGAVIKESLRIHPIAGATFFERIVPAAGLKVPDSDVVLPEGTVVSVFPRLSACDKKIYGADADIFRPERWMKGENESEAEFRERIAAMNSSDISFGKGSRACLGKHIAELELFKTVSTLAALMDIEMDPPEKEWNVEYMFFAKQTNMDVKIKWRPGVVKEEIIG